MYRKGAQPIPSIGFGVYVALLGGPDWAADGAADRAADRPAAFATDFRAAGLALALARAELTLDFLVEPLLFMRPNLQQRFAEGQSTRAVSPYAKEHSCD